jgi:sugar PTS system EIIA component
MSLFGKEVKNIDENIVYSPMNGDVIKLEEVNDPVFSQKMMGEGIAIKPKDNSIYSPVSGVVTMIFPTKHAIGITKDNNVGVILHIGIETVNLKGDGFDLKVKVGQKIKVGDLLMNIDLEKISKKYDPTTIIVFDNLQSYKVKELASGACLAGQPLLKLEQ